jgi:antitoxin ParD1/3/4
MTRSINLSLTDELRAFVDRNSGEGTLYATPSEFVRALIREKKERADAAAIRQAVLEGYEDVLQDRTVPYAGDLRTMLAEFRERHRH